MSNNSSVGTLRWSFHRALRLGMRVLRREGPQQVQFWFIALAIGIAAGFAALLFRLGIERFQASLYRSQHVSHLISAAESLPWYWIIAFPVLGGLTVGIILDRFTDDGRVRSVAQVIEGAALHDGRVEQKAGLASFAASFITLSTGGRAGERARWCTWPR